MSSKSAGSELLSMMALVAAVVAAVILIFFGLGFETTMPSAAMTLIQARAQGIRNFSLFCNHITIIPTIKAILDSPDLRLDGFLGPGNVSMFIGTRP